MRKSIAIMATIIILLPSFAFPLTMREIGEDDDLFVIFLAGGIFALGKLGIPLSDDAIIKGVSPKYHDLLREAYKAGYGQWVGKRNLPKIKPKQEENPVVLIEKGFRKIGPFGTGHIEYSWKANLRNVSSERQKGLVTIRLLDKDGFELGMNNEHYSLAPKETRTFIGKGYLENYLYEQLVSFEVELSVYPKF